MNQNESATCNLDIAYDLAAAGVPVICGRLTADGNPNGKHDARWMSWQSKIPGPRTRMAIRSWHPGEALAMVAGHVYDIIDVDPRNGGLESFRKLATELGDNKPQVYLKVRTPSGGHHLYIESLGIGTFHGFLPGIDLQGGKPDGTGRGLVFIPPTVRPSKGDGWRAGRMRPYVARCELQAVNGHRTGAAVRKLILAYAEAQQPEGNSRAANPPSSLRQACKDAEAGEQRGALLRYVHELERMGIEPEAIADACESMKLVNFDPMRPWRRQDFLGLCHKPGRVIADATEDEMAEIAGGIQATRAWKETLVRRADEFMQQKVVWLWVGYLAREILTVLDGIKGQGKSTLAIDIAARASRGDPMPDGTGGGRPLRVIIFTREDKPGIALVPRLKAAGADLRNVFFHVVPPKPKRKRGEKEQPDLWELPGGADNFRDAIRQAGADLAIFDPITDFYDEKTQISNDASLRRAVAPLTDVLSKTSCSGLAIRHMNQKTDQEARFRGSGGSALQNMGRIHLVAGEVEPIDWEGIERRRFAVMQVDVNYTRLAEQALSYVIVDSDIPLDDEGNYIGKLDLTGWITIDANDLTRGKKDKPGPQAIETEMIMALLRELFEDRDTWSVKEMEAAISNEGLSTRQMTVEEARLRLGRDRDVLKINKFPVHRSSGGVDHWVWTTKTRQEWRAGKAMRRG